MKKVLLGMSGGIDSSVSALLLLEQGYEATGATMSFWDDSIPVSDWPHHGCFGPHEKDNIASARKTCANLSIPHLVIPLQQEFDQLVLDYFRATYLEGKTPNPCVRCNSLVKFGAFWQKASQLATEFDCFATGHYVRKRWSDEARRWQLLQALDPLKDQSYFLAFLSQEQIARTLFPLGELSKDEVRQYAREHGLAELTARDESQDFLDADVYPQIFPADAFQEGDIIDTQGRVLGQHRGLMHYTIGQRRHLGLGGGPNPWFVVELDAARNRVVVGPYELLFKDRLSAGGFNWVSIAAPRDEFRALARIRLSHHSAPCLVKPLSENQMDVQFDQPQLSVTPGQAVVLYDGETLLGGGFID